MLKNILNYSIFFVLYLITCVPKCYSNDILGCGGFVQSHASLDFSKIEIGLYTKEGSLKEKTECAPTNGYYFLPLYEQGEYVLKIHPPAGWSFEPSEVELLIDGETDQCSTGQDINFAFNGFGITGRVITAGHKEGPSGINVQLVSNNGDVRNTITAIGGDFHFTPVIPGKYLVKASHPKWKLEPGQTVVQVKEGNTALSIGSLSVKGFDVSGSVTSFGSFISGIYVLLYSKNDNQQFRVEGCKTALLQGVPDAPICHSITDGSGEFHFGLVPAGEYKLIAISKSPGQPLISYSIKPGGVLISVKHDSLYIKNAFEVTGFTVIGSVLSSLGGTGMQGVRVLLNTEPVANTDASGKFTLAGLKPATYTLNFQHEKCQWDELETVITSNGLSHPLRAVVSRWLVCGHVTPPEPRRLAIRPQDSTTYLLVQAQNDGKWCTFLPPGTYMAKVEVSEQEQREGLQFYPEWHSIAVSRSPVDGISFGAVRLLVSGEVQCGQYCAGLQVTLRPLSADGAYSGPPRHAQVVDGKYAFEEVVPGSVEVSIGGDRLCWAQAAHNAAITQQLHTLPPFVLKGLAMEMTTTHLIEVEYKSKTEYGVLTLPAGKSRLCVPIANEYSLTPRGCHLVEPPQTTVKMNVGNKVPSVSFVAKAHSAVIKVISSEAATDLVLQISSDGQVEQNIPLKPKQQDSGYVYEHKIYLAEGDVALVIAQSPSLLFTPRGPQRVLGQSECQSQALVLRAAKALTLAGKIFPPVADVVVTLAGDDIKLIQTTKANGLYSFGPLDASIQYTITAEKESYVFGERDEKGYIVSYKLAEIIVKVVDGADNVPLEGALVSVSGGSFRRNMASGPTGVLRFGALSPAQYYVKPNMKEFRFEPPHAIVPVQDGMEYTEVFLGVRVAWSVHGRAISLGGIGVARVSLRARPATPSLCPQQDATTTQSGAFRIRGLLPNCIYTIELKESTEPDLVGIELAQAPTRIEVKEQDIVNVRLILIQPNQLTDTNILIRTPNIDHYKTLRLTLTLESTSNPIFSTKLDPSGYSQTNNPGLMYVMPRLPADNKTYILQVESTLSKVSHSYEESVFYFNSDGKFRSFDVDFVPKVKSSEQELRQSSLLILPLLAALGFLYTQRHRLQSFRQDVSKRIPRKKMQ